MAKRYSSWQMVPQPIRRLRPAPWPTPPARSCSTLPMALHCLLQIPQAGGTVPRLPPLGDNRVRIADSSIANARYPDPSKPAGPFRVPTPDGPMERDPGALPAPAADWGVCRIPAAPCARGNGNSSGQRPPGPMRGGIASLQRVLPFILPGFCVPAAAMAAKSVPSRAPGSRCRGSPFLRARRPPPPGSGPGTS